MSKLGFLRADWERAEIATNEYITPEDGAYRAAIEEVKYTEMDREGNPSDPTFIYTFRIMEGKTESGRDYRGQKFRRYTTIRNEKSASYFKGDLQKLGMPIPADPEELPGLFMSAAGIVLDLTVKTKVINGKEYKDVYFDKLVGRQTPQQQVPQQQVPQYQQPRQFTDARAQPPQGFYQQARQFTDARAQPQAFGAGYVENEEIPF